MDDGKGYIRHRWGRVEANGGGTVRGWNTERRLLINRLKSQDVSGRSSYLYMQRSDVGRSGNSNMNMNVYGVDGELLLTAWIYKLKQDWLSHRLTARRSAISRLQPGPATPATYQIWLRAWNETQLAAFIYGEIRKMQKG